MWQTYRSSWKVMEGMTWMTNTSTGNKTRGTEGLIRDSTPGFKGEFYETG